MYMMGELKLFLSFQIKQLKDDTFVSQTKYTQDMLKKFDMENTKPIKTLMPTNGHIAYLKIERPWNKSISLHDWIPSLPLCI